VSHSKERKEKVCLNCQTPLYGRFCHICGQENIEAKQTVWDLVAHFFYDITHFDGKFFTTFKDLVLKPGFLSSEYMAGRRSSYLNPIRMYVFTSALFFLIFFAIVNPKQMKFNSGTRQQRDSVLRNVDQKINGALAEAKDKADSDVILKGQQGWKKIHAPITSDSSSKDSSEGVALAFDDNKFKTVEAYDSAQHKLPVDRQDGWLKQLYTHKSIEIKAKYDHDQAGFYRDWMDTFVHNFPKLLFISLPLFALMLKLLYIRRKQYFYVDHGIFAIHLYIFAFSAMLILFGLSHLRIALHWDWVSWVEFAVYVFWLFYLYKAMHNFYHQGRVKTIFKYALLMFMFATFTSLLMGVFLLFSILEL